MLNYRTDSIIVADLKSSNDTDKSQEAENDVLFENFLICFRPMSIQTSSHSLEIRSSIDICRYMSILVLVLVVLYPYKHLGRVQIHEDGYYMCMRGCKALVPPRILENFLPISFFSQPKLVRLVPLFVPKISQHSLLANFKIWSLLPFNLVCTINI